MKSNPLVGLLMAILFLNAAFTGLLAYQYVRSLRALQTLQYQRVVMTQQLNFFNALVGDTMEYSKRNPAIDTVLQSIGLKTNRPAATPVSVPTQPAGKK